MADHDFRKAELPCYRLYRKWYPAHKYIWLYNTAMPYEVETPEGKSTSWPDAIIIDRDGLAVVAVIELKWITAERIERLKKYGVKIHLATTDGGVRHVATIEGEQPIRRGMAAKRSRAKALIFDISRITPNQWELSRGLAKLK